MKKMLELSSGNGYSLKRFRDNLKIRCKDHVHFVEGQGRHCEFVCFKDKTDYILREMKTNF